MTTPLRCFLAVSVCLHIAALLYWNPVRNIALGQPGDILRLVLAEQAAPKHPESRPAAESDTQPTDKALTLANSSNTSITSMDKQVRQQNPANNHPAPERNHSVFESTPYAPPGVRTSPQRQASQISAAIRRQLAAYFRYPRLAQQRGWQGQVMLRVHLDPDGRMSRVHIVQSSGYSLLDHSALRSAENAAYVPDVIEWLAGQHFDTVVPVRYRLIDS